MKYSLPLVLATSTIIPVISAQETLPEDLRATIEEDSTEIQVSYSGDASDGFDDATIFSPDDTQDPPEFALGEFSGIGSRNNFLLAMIDTTCDDKRTLHLLQPELRNTGVKTQLGSETDPIVEYIAPGASGEQGTRQYSFVIWRTKQDLEYVSVPAAGETFDVASFEEENDLKDPEAGIAMIVELGGEADCEVREIESVPIPEDSTPVGEGRGSDDSESETEEEEEDSDDDDSLPNNDFVNDGDGKDDNDLSDDAPNSNGEFSNNSDNNDGDGNLLDSNDDDDEDTETEAEDNTEVNDSVAGSSGSDDSSSNESSEGSSLPNNDFDNVGDGKDDNDLSDDAPNSNGEFSNNSKSNDDDDDDDSNSSAESLRSTQGDEEDDGDSAQVLDTPSLEVDAASSLLKSRAVLAAAGLSVVAALFA